jgi:hypothetical protein
VHEAYSEDDVSPLLIWLNLLEEVLVDERVEGTLQTSGNTLRRLSSDLNGHLEQTKSEAFVRLTSDEETESVVHLFTLGVEEFFHLGHELETKMTVVEDNPESITHGVIHMFLCDDLLLLSHGYLLSRNSFLSGELINGPGRIRTRGKQVDDRLGWCGLLPRISDLISDCSHILFTKDASDELL